MTRPDSGLQVCVTGAFGDVRALRSFIVDNPDVLQDARWLVEVRLDLMPGCIDDALVLVSELRSKAVVSCRSKREGGGFPGQESDRLEVLARAAAAGPGYVDVELSTWLKGGAEPIRRACSGGCRVMLSVHETGSSGYFADHAGRLNGIGADAVKLAGTVRDGDDLIRLARAGRMLEAPVRCVVAMGPGAAFSRMRPADFNSTITFASAGAGLETADGQPSFRRLEDWRVFESTGLEPVVLAGGEQVVNSPGPDIYNRIFRRRAIPMQYLPLPVSGWEQVPSACEFFGIRKFAVTMPHKFRPIAQWPDADIDARASMTGVVNTVVTGGGRVRLLNTDSTGASEIFDRLGGIAGMDVLIMGGGATARSISAAALVAGASVTVAARAFTAVSRSWPAQQAAARFKGWERRGEASHDIVVNATPLGGEGRIGFGEPPPLKASVAAIDVVIRSQGATQMIESAMNARVRFATGLDFWCAQAPAQLEAFTGAPFGFDEVARAMAETGHPCTGVMAELDRTLPGSALDEVSIAVPGSKSMTQRCLVLASLARCPSRIVHPSRSRDCRELQAALGMMGVRFGVTSDALDVYPGDFPRDPERPVPTGEGGTTLRFLAALSLICDFPLSLVPSGTMIGRPGEPLFDALTAAGVDVSHSENMVTLRRRGDPAGPIHVSSDVSSQFASALLMAGAGISRGLEISLDGDVVSRPYLDMTVEIIRMFGGAVTVDGVGYQVRHQRNVPGLRINIEGDASLAAIWEAAAMIYGRRIVMANRPDAASGIQGDAVYPLLFDRLRSPGFVQIDLKDTPDLLPPMVIAALFREAGTAFCGVGHARLKESDRLHVLADRLRGIGADIVEGPDSLTIGPARLRGPATLDPAGDHRMAMAFGILSLRVPGLKIADPECVDKSYPAFWQDLETVRN